MRAMQQQHTMASAEPPCYFIFSLPKSDQVGEFQQQGLALNVDEWAGFRGSGFFDPQPGFGFTEALYFEVDAWAQKAKLTYTISWGGRDVTHGSSTMQFPLPLNKKTEGNFTNWRGKPGVAVRNRGDAWLSRV